MDRTRSNKFKTEHCSENSSVSSLLPATKGAIAQRELLSHVFKTPLTFRNGILKRYLKETFRLSSPFPYFSVLPRHSASSFLCVCVWLSDFSAVITYSPVAITSLTVILWRYTGVKDNWSWGCLVCGNRESGTLCQRCSLYVQRHMIQRWGLHKRSSVFPNTNRCILLWRKLLEMILMRFHESFFLAVIGLDT